MEFELNCEIDYRLKKIHIHSNATSVVYWCRSDQICGNRRKVLKERETQSEVGVYAAVLGYLN